jgi:hypothetical protein
MLHSLNLNSVARPGARGVRCAMKASQARYLGNYHVLLAIAVASILLGVSCAHDRGNIIASFEPTSKAPTGFGGIHCLIADREGKPSNTYDLVLKGTCLQAPLQPYVESSQQMITMKLLEQGIYDFPLVPACDDLQLEIVARCQLYLNDPERQCDTQRYRFPVVVKAGQCTNIAIRVGCYHCNWVFY